MLERYELLYEAGLVAEPARPRRAFAQPEGWQPMISDHRGSWHGLSRLRGKLKYRPWCST